MGWGRAGGVGLESVANLLWGFLCPHWASIGPPLGPHWPLVQPILPILRIPAGALGVPKPCGLDFSRFFIDFALKTSTTLPQILLKINSFNVVFKDSYKIADFEKHRKNLGFSQVFLGF